jgi:hypothetical protein
MPDEPDDPESRVPGWSDLFEHFDGSTPEDIANSVAAAMLAEQRAELAEHESPALFLTVGENAAVAPGPGLAPGVSIRVRGPSGGGADVRLPAPLIAHAMSGVVTRNPLLTILACQLVGQAGHQPGGDHHPIGLGRPDMDAIREAVRRFRRPPVMTASSASWSAAGTFC